jgi:hypothetical protein
VAPVSKKARKKLTSLLVKDIRSALKEEDEQGEGSTPSPRGRIDTGTAEDHVYRIIRGMPSVIIANIKGDDDEWEGGEFVRRCPQDRGTLNPATKEETKFFVTLMMSRWGKDDGDYDPEDPRGRGVRDLLLEVKEELIDMMNEKGEITPSNAPGPLAQQEETTMGEEAKEGHGAPSGNFDDNNENQNESNTMLVNPEVGSGLASGYLPSISFPTFVRDLFAVTSEMALTPNWEEEGEKSEPDSPFDGPVRPPSLPFASSLPPSLRMSNDPLYLDLSTGLTSVEMAPAILNKEEASQGIPLLLSVEIGKGKKGKDVINITSDNKTLLTGLISDKQIGSSSVEMRPKSEGKGRVEEKKVIKPLAQKGAIPLVPRKDWMREGDDRYDEKADADWGFANTLLRKRAREHKREEEDYRRNRIVLANTRKALLEGRARTRRVEKRGEDTLP